jgi:hypothetical protein
MSRWLALARSGCENTELSPDIRTKPDKTSEIQPEVGFCQVVSNCPVGGENKVDAPDTDAFEERAAIAEFDGGLSRDDAEDLAAQCQGYDAIY